MGIFGAAGSAIKKQFDDKPGGGVVDTAAGGTADVAFEKPNEAANFYFGGIGSDAGKNDDPVGSDSFDASTTSISESIENQFDDKAGGGFVDQTTEFASNTAGAIGTVTTKPTLSYLGFGGKKKNKNRNPGDDPKSAGIPPVLLIAAAGIVLFLLFGGGE